MGVGYMLSPLSWWNDLFFNLPIAYGFGLVVSWFRPDWLIPGTVVGYWLSNVLGFVMMQFGASDILQGDRPKRWKRELLISLGSSTAYTLIVVLLLQFHWLETPTFLTELIR